MEPFLWWTRWLRPHDLKWTHFEVWLSSFRGFQYFLVFSCLPFWVPTDAQHSPLFLTSSDLPGVCFPSRWQQHHMAAMRLLPQPSRADLLTLPAPAGIYRTFCKPGLWRRMGAKNHLEVDMRNRKLAWTERLPSLKFSLSAELSTLSCMAVLFLIVSQENWEAVIACTKSLKLSLIFSPALVTDLLPFEKASCWLR